MLPTRVLLPATVSATIALPVLAQDIPPISVYTTVAPSFEAMQEALSARSHQDALVFPGTQRPLFEVTGLDGDVPVPPLDDTLVDFMKANDLDRLQFQGGDGLVFDLSYLETDGGLTLAYNPREVPFDLYLKDGDPLFLSLEDDFTLFNTGDIEGAPTGIAKLLADLKVPVSAIAPPNSGRIGGVPTQVDKVLAIAAPLPENAVFEPYRPNWSSLAIQRKGDERNPICTGVAISPSLVLSAAHCFCEDIDHPEIFRASVTYQQKGGGKDDQLQHAIQVDGFIQFPGPPNDSNDEQRFCLNPGSATARAAYGDIVLLHLKTTIPDALATAKSAVLRNLSPFATAKLIAADQPIWGDDAPVFTTFGFGLGPRLDNPNLRDVDATGLRRNMDYTLANGSSQIGRNGIVLAEFAQFGAEKTEDNATLCPGDSGSGLFVPSAAAEDPETPTPGMALAGIASKIGTDRRCFVSNDKALFEPTAVVRLDTSAVQAWLVASAQSLGESLNFVSAAPRASWIVASDLR